MKFITASIKFGLRKLNDKIYLNDINKGFQSAFKETKLESLKFQKKDKKFNLKKSFKKKFQQKKIIAYKNAQDREKFINDL